jgi:hypothetical protein
MNNTDEFSDLEAELEQLQPSRITAAFSERVSTGLHAGEVALEPSGYGIRGNRLFILSVGALAAAAAIALVFFLHDRQDRKDANAPSYQSPALVSAVDAIEAPPAGSSNFRPDELEYRLMEATDEGLFLIDDGAPARRTRYQFVDSYRWENPDDGSTIRLSIPRDEVLLVRLQTI